MNLRKLKILYFAVDQKNYVKENWEFFKSELKKLPEVQVKFVYSGGDIKDIIKKLNFTPDFIYFDDFKKTKSLQITGLNQVGIPKGLLNVDLQTDRGDFKKFVKSNKIDLIFSIYRDAFFQFYPEFAKKFVWFPHHVFTSVFQNYGLNKNVDFLLMGATDRNLYPLRAKMVHELRDVPGFVHHKHPGYRYFSEREQKNALIGKNYAQEINRAKMFFTCDSIYKYPIAKYYEVTACKTLLLGAGSQELKDLGFINRETFVEINKNNYFEKAKYYLRHEKRRRFIARQGYEMVRAHHTTEIRVGQFVDCIMRYLGWKDKLDQNAIRQKWVILYEETPSGI